MAKEKIQGWTDPLGCFQEGKKPEEIYCSFDAATLVVHDSDKHERVFTASEVRAMLEDMRNDPLTDELQRSGVIEPIAAKHGIALDPV